MVHNDLNKDEPQRGMDANCKQKIPGPQDRGTQETKMNQ